MDIDEKAPGNRSQQEVTRGTDNQAGGDSQRDAPEVPLPADDEAPVEEELLDVDASNRAKRQTSSDDIPAHSTEEERERLKDFNKGGIPPGSC
jgi:hypothetical protein